MLQGRDPGHARPRPARPRVDELLELVGIADAADRVVKGYSGGMSRRLDIALGLVHRPQVLFLDEPTTGLDPEARVAMWAEVARLAAAGVADDPADDALPRGGRPARRPARDRLAAARWSSRARRTELKRGLRGDAVHVELDERRGRATRSACSRASARRRAGARRRAHARLARRRTAAQALPGILSALDGAGSASPRSPSHGRRSTTSTSTTRAATSRAEDRRPVNVLRAHVVHGRAPGAQPDARADLDRAAADPADGLARCSTASCSRNVTRLGGFGTDSYIDVPRARDRRHERVLRRRRGAGWR